MENNRKYENYKNFDKLEFQKAVAIAEIDGETVAVTERGTVFDKQYAELLRNIYSNINLSLEVPDHIIVEPAVIDAIIDVIKARIIELFKEKGRNLQLVHEFTDFENKFNKHIRSKEGLLKVSLPRFELNISECFAQIPEKQPE